MRPSQYHYIKRIWTRNAYRKKNNGCLGGIANTFLRLFFFFLFIGIAVYLGMIALGVIIGVLFCIGVFKLLKWIFNIIHNAWKNSQNKGSVILTNTIGEEITSSDTLSAKNILNRVITLADTINTTIDRDVFEQSLQEIKKELAYLQKFEGKVNFSGSTPTEDLRRIEENEDLTRQKFNQRVSKSGEKHSEPKTNFKKKSNEIKTENRNEEKIYHSHKVNNFDLERFMIECNAQMEHDDEMEQYKDCN